MQGSLGKISGKTSTTQFDFIITPGAAVKKWDYITFIHPEAGTVLAQVREIVKQNSDTTAHCSIIGFRTDRGFLRQPRTPPAPQSDIFLTEDHFLKNILGLRETGLYLGLLEGKDTLKAFFDPKKIMTQHLAVLARSGSGKSYAIGVLLEELMELKVPIVVIDPHGEYGSIRNSNKHTDDEKYFAAYGIAAKGYRSQVRELAINTSINPEAEQLKLAIPQNPNLMIESLPFKITNTQRGLLYNAIEDLRKKKPKYDFNDIIGELEFSESASKWNLITGFQNLANSRLFSFEPTTPEMFVKQGQMTIVNLKGAQPEVQQMVVQALASELFEMRKQNIVPPFFMVIEESHNFCPERGFGEAQSSRIIRSIASEGRKFGLGIAIISQRSARVDKSVLSQTGSQIILQVTNPNDLKAVSSSFEGVTSETEEEVKNLPIGKALVIGAADYPIFVDVRVRRSQHGGRAQTFDFTAKAQSAYAPGVSRPKEVVREPIQDVVSREAEEAPKNLVLVFPPRVLPKDIVMIETGEVKRAPMALRPCYSTNTPNGLVVVDGIESAVYSFTNKLSWAKVPPFITKLSPEQKKLLAAAATSSTISEIFAKSGIPFSSVNTMVQSFVRAGMMKTDGNNVALHPDLKKMGELASARFVAKPEYMDVPGEKINYVLSEKEVLDLLKQLGISATALQKCYIPFYKVELASGKNKVIDALSYSLEI